MHPPRPKSDQINLSPNSIPLPHTACTVSKHNRHLTQQQGIARTSTTSSPQHHLSTLPLYHIPHRVVGRFTYNIPLHISHPVLLLSPIPQHPPQPRPGHVLCCAFSHEVSYDPCLYPLLMIIQILTNYSTTTRRRHPIVGHLIIHRMCHTTYPPQCVTLILTVFQFAADSTRRTTSAAASITSIN